MPTPNIETSPSGREYTAFSIGRGYGSKIFGQCSARLFLGRTQRPLCIQDLELPKSLQRKRLRLIYHLVHAQTARLRRSVAFLEGCKKTGTGRERPKRNVRG